MFALSCRGERWFLLWDESYFTWDVNHRYVQHLLLKMTTLSGSQAAPREFLHPSCRPSRQHKHQELQEIFFFLHLLLSAGSLIWRKQSGMNNDAPWVDLFLYSASFCCHGPRLQLEAPEELVCFLLNTLISTSVSTSEWSLHVHEE